MFNHLSRFIVVVFLVSVVLTSCASTPKTISTNAPVREGGEGGGGNEAPAGPTLTNPGNLPATPARA